MATPAAERSWFIVGRWEEYEGEGRANLLRVIGLVAFYLVELVNYHGLNLGFLQMPSIVSRGLHLAISMVVLVWACVCLAVYVCRIQGVFPKQLKFLSTGADLVLLTTIIALAEGPKSPLLVVYFIILGLAALRFNLALIWFATAGAVLCYLCVLAYGRWFLPATTNPPTLPIVVPRFHQVIMIFGLALTGVILGQIIRRVRKLAEFYAEKQREQAGGMP
jgi:hypothetical protein